MTPDLSYYTVEASGTLLDAAESIAKNKSRCVVVIESGKAIGVLSEGDLVRALLRGTDINSPMRPLVKHGFLYLEKKDPERALQLFRSHGISLIPILDSALTLTDVIPLTEMLQSLVLAPQKA